MLPEAYITHQLPGRVRLQVPSRRKDAAYFEQLRQTLLESEQIDLVSPNPLTGAVLVLHHSSTAAVVALGQQTGLFRLAEPPSFERTVAQRAGTAIGLADRRIATLSRGALDLNSLIIMGFAGLSVVQLFRSRVAPPALTLLWYALGLARKE